MEATISNFNLRELRAESPLRSKKVQRSATSYRVGKSVKLMPNGDFAYPLYEVTSDNGASEMSGIWDTLTQGKNVVAGYISTRANAVSSTARSAARRVYDKAGNVISYAQSVPGKVIGKADQAVSVVGRAARGTLSLAERARNDAIQTAGRVARGTLNTARQGRNDVIKAGGKVVRGVTRAGTTGFSAVGDAVSNTAGNLAQAGSTIAGALPDVSTLGVFAGTAISTGTWIFVGIGALLLVVVMKTL